MRYLTNINLLEELYTPPTYKIYCDMDGVLCDFEERFEYFTGIPPQDYKNKYGDRQFWELIDQEVGSIFWENMQWMKKGRELWNFIKKYKPNILTTPSYDKSSREGKKTWVQKNLSNYDKLLFTPTEGKQAFADGNSILIDDLGKNLTGWSSRGGISVKCRYNNVDEVIQELKELGYR